MRFRLGQMPLCDQGVQQRTQCFTVGLSFGQVLRGRAEFVPLKEGQTERPVSQRMQPGPFGFRLRCEFKCFIESSEPGGKVGNFGPFHRFVRNQRGEAPPIAERLGLHAFGRAKPRQSGQCVQRIFVLNRAAESFDGLTDFAGRFVRFPFEKPSVRVEAIRVGLLRGTKMTQSLFRFCVVMMAERLWI
jgi:hypothetical protein